MRECKGCTLHEYERKSGDYRTCTRGDCINTHPQRGGTSIFPVAMPIAKPTAGTKTVSSAVSSQTSKPPCVVPLVYRKSPSPSDACSPRLNFTRGAVSESARLVSSADEATPSTSSPARGGGGGWHARGGGGGPHERRDRRARGGRDGERGVSAVRAESGTDGMKAASISVAVVVQCAQSV